jgi:hypothetical protein
MHTRLMDSREWHFRLAGDEFDINGVAELFGSEVKIIKDEHGQRQLVMELPFTNDESEAAQFAGEEVLAKLNAIANVVYGNHQNLTITGIGCRDPSGATMHLFLHVGMGGRSRFRAGIGTVQTNPSSAPSAIPKMTIGDQFLHAADKDEHLERALYLFGSLQPDWRGLYMVLEAAEDAHAGERGLVAKKWVPDGQIKDFKATANSYKALRLAARHGSTKEGIEVPRLTVSEARDMVRTILEKWTKTLL